MAENKVPAKAPEDKGLSKDVKLTAAERFTNKVIQLFQAQAGPLELADYHKRLAQGYFIGTDHALKMAEEKRASKNKSNKDHKYDNVVPYTWDSVDLDAFALDVVHFARMGLDMRQKNHISPIPYAQGDKGKYGITLMPGYNGIEYTALKYALEPPKAVTIELVYETDDFRPIKKAVDNPIEAYHFEIKNAFNRGKIVGGFGYIQYEDMTKNKLLTLSAAEIEKRKPSYASAEFWGGDKEVYNKGTNKREVKHIEGWPKEMYYKTMVRFVFGEANIPRDPKKIDDDYLYMKQREAEYAKMAMESEIEENAATEAIDVDYHEMPSDIDPDTGEIIESEAPAPSPEAVKSPSATTKDKSKGTAAQQTKLGETP